MIESIRNSANTGGALGNDCFKDEVEMMMSRRREVGQRSRSRHLVYCKVSSDGLV